MKKKTVIIIIVSVLLLLTFGFLTNFSKVYYYFNDAVSFRFENESGQKIYSAAVSFGTEDKAFGSLSGENADGTPLSNKGKECLVLPIEEGDLNDTKIEDMIFDFFVCTQKDSDFTYVGTVIVTSSKLHQTYNLTLIEKDGKLVLDSNESNIKLIDNIKNWFS